MVSLTVNTTLQELVCVPSLVSAHIKTYLCTCAVLGAITIVYFYSSDAICEGCVPTTSSKQVLQTIKCTVVEWTVAHTGEVCQVTRVHHN